MQDRDPVQYACAHTHTLADLSPHVSIVTTSYASLTTADRHVSVPRVLLSPSDDQMIDGSTPPIYDPVDFVLGHLRRGEKL